MKAVILVGGPSRGTRFRPLSLRLPKPLFPIAGLPMISHHIDALARLNPEQIYLLGFYEEIDFQPIIFELTQRYSVQISYLKEPMANLGTGSGLYIFRDLLETDVLLILHGDIACTFPLSELVQQHVSAGAQCTILGKEVERDIAKKYGCIVHEQNKVLHYVEKPESFLSQTISAGIYAFKPHTLFERMDVFLNQPVKPPRKNSIASITDIYPRISLERDILASLPETGQFYIYTTTDFWCQIKTAQ